MPPRNIKITTEKIIDQALIDRQKREEESIKKIKENYGHAVDLMIRHNYQSALIYLNRAYDSILDNNAKAEYGGQIKDKIRECKYLLAVREFEWAKGLSNKDKYVEVRALFYDMDIRYYKDSQTYLSRCDQKIVNFERRDRFNERFNAFSRLIRKEEKTIDDYNDIISKADELINKYPDLLSNKARMDIMDQMDKIRECKYLLAVREFEWAEGSSNKDRYVKVRSLFYDMDIRYYKDSQTYLSRCDQKIVNFERRDRFNERFNAFSRLIRKEEKTIDDHKDIISKADELINRYPDLLSNEARKDIMDQMEISCKKVEKNDFAKPLTHTLMIGLSFILFILICCAPDEEILNIAIRFQVILTIVYIAVCINLYN